MYVLYIIYTLVIKDRVQGLGLTKWEIVEDIVAHLLITIYLKYTANFPVLYWVPGSSCEPIHATLFVYMFVVQCTFMYKTYAPLRGLNK